MLTARCSIGAALLVLACGGSVDGDRSGISRAGNAGTSGNANADAGNTGGTGGKSSGGTAGTVQGGTGATLPIGTGAVLGVGGIIPGGGGFIPGGAPSTGAAPGTGGEVCGPGGCITPTDVPPISPPGPVICGGVECAAPRACCTMTSTCYDPVASPEACPKPAPDNDPWGRKACASNAQCGSREFCQLDSANRLCQGQGHCNPIGNCGACFSTEGLCKVCGCDGNTYPDMQTACLAGANMVGVQGGGCGETIQIDGAGGSSSSTPRFVTPCGTSQHCKTGELCCSITGLCYPASDPDRCRVPPPGTRFPCTSNDQCESYEYCLGDGCSGPGGCVPLGPQEDCGVTLEPVCGCDGKTYTSAPCAAFRGVRVAAQGECVAP